MDKGAAMGPAFLPAVLLSLLLPVLLPEGSPKVLFFDYEVSEAGSLSAGVISFIIIQ